jgi:hypothetical protein
MIPQVGDRVTVGAGTCEYLVLGLHEQANGGSMWVLQGPAKRRYVDTEVPLHVVPSAALDAVHEERAGRR